VAKVEVMFEMFVRSARRMSYGEALERAGRALACTRCGFVRPKAGWAGCPADASVEAEPIDPLGLALLETGHLYDVKCEGRLYEIEGGQVQGGVFKMRVEGIVPAHDAGPCSGRAVASFCPERIVVRGDSAAYCVVKEVSIGREILLREPLSSYVFSSVLYVLDLKIIVCEEGMEFGVLVENTSRAPLRFEADVIGSLPR
jgi:hypothetical protein